MYLPMYAKSVITSYRNRDNKSVLQSNGYLHWSNVHFLRLINLNIIIYELLKLLGAIIFVLILSPRLDCISNIVCVREKCGVLVWSGSEISVVCSVSRHTAATTSHCCWSCSCCQPATPSPRPPGPPPSSAVAILSPDYTVSTPVDNTFSLIFRGLITKMSV